MKANTDAGFETIGGVSDLIALNGHYAAKRCPAHFRRIRFRDPETPRPRDQQSIGVPHQSVHAACAATATDALVRATGTFAKWLQKYPER